MCSRPPFGEINLSGLYPSLSRSCPTYYNLHRNYGEKQTTLHPQIASSIARTRGLKVRLLADNNHNYSEELTFESFQRESGCGTYIA